MFDAQAEFAKLVGSRSRGVYMPPACLRALQQAAASDTTSPEYQAFAENLIQGRGLFARCVIKAQAASLPFLPLIAALVAIINTKFPQVGELQFRRSFKRNDKVCVIYGKIPPSLISSFRSSATQLPHSWATLSIKLSHMSLLPFRSSCSC